jgi:hypothetical protein
MSQILSYLWGSSKKDTPENENAELAMREQLDAHQDFRIKEDGVMEWDDFVVLRCVIQRQAYRHYNPHWVKIKKASHTLWKQNPSSIEYAQNFADGQRAFAAATKLMTEKACEWIEFDLKNFV